VELEALDAVVLHQVKRLAGTELALVRIDRGERNQDIAFLGAGLGNLVVVVAAKSGFALRIDRKDHRCDVHLAIVRRGFGNGRRMLPGRSEILRHRALQIVIAVVGMAAAGLLGMGMRVDCADF
jgi:microcompartment protein CcmK/EutM